jgi:hypothetical protein
MISHTAGNYRVEVRALLPGVKVLRSGTLGDILEVG